MNNKNKRPVYLNLFQIRLPVAGVVSILHRITGVVMVISLPLSLYALQQSLASADEYATVTGYLSLPGVRVLLMVLAVALALHFLAGVRHLLLDIDVGITRRVARWSAWAVLAGTGLTALVFGMRWL